VKIAFHCAKIELFWRRIEVTSAMRICAFYGPKDEPSKGLFPLLKGDPK
jgi:hypothetical protein